MYVDENAFKDLFATNPIHALEGLKQFNDNYIASRRSSSTSGIVEDKASITKPDVAVDGLESSKSRLSLRNSCKTIVCHDMRGGYLHDRYDNGSSFDPETMYSIYHWSCIDIFIYFSHNFVSIPPVCWINVCHRHNVPILGTIITEWKEGYQLCFKVFGQTYHCNQSHICSKIGENCDGYDDFDWHNLAEYFANVMDSYQFDGWLVNIENPFENPSITIPRLIAFLTRLRNLCKKVNPDALIIW